MPPAFLDSNVILRHLLADHPIQSPKATNFLSKIENGEISVHISDTVVFEIVFTLERYYKKPKVAIKQALLPLLELPNIFLPGIARYQEAFDLYVGLNLPFADAFHAVLASRLASREIISYDKHYDRVSKIKRREP